MAGVPAATIIESLPIKYRGHAGEVEQVKSRCWRDGGSEFTYIDAPCPPYKEGQLMSHAQALVTISIQAKIAQRDLIDRAADRLGRSRSDFMLEAACKQAEDVLLDQTYFALDAKAIAAFRKLLDSPPAPSGRLLRTLKAKAPWDSAR